jgi:hypothetical protein
MGQRNRSAPPPAAGQAIDGHMVRKIIHTAVLALGRELVAWNASAERAVFGTQAMLSVGLAVASAYALHLRM